MPITLPPLSRRQFLAASVAAGVTLLGTRRIWGAGTDADHVAILSDAHIGADKALIFRETALAANLSKCCTEILALESKPAFALVNGDCALKSGEAADYATFLSLIKPLREAGLPVHLTLGNHDHREEFWRSIGPGTKSPVDGRHVSLVEMPRANWLLLDSLDETDKAPGLLGEKQLAWLAKALDARAGKPLIIVVHHNPAQGSKPGALTDSAALLDVLKPRQQVKAIIFGHTHDWSHSEHDGIHFLNLPPTAYVFTPGRPNGWVDAYVRDDGLWVQLHALDAKHAQAWQELDLKWR